MKKEDYNKLKKQIEEQYKQALALAEKERIEGLAAIDTVWKMFHKPRKRRKTGESQQQPESANSSHLSTSPRVYGALIETAKKSLDFVPEEFTCRQMIVAMKQVSDNTFNYSSVSNRLKRMAQENVIEMVKQGHGKSPSVYRLKTKESALIK